MNPITDEIKRFLEFSNDYVQKELSEMGYENFDEILEIINHYITDEISYDQSLQYFLNEELPIHIIDKIHDIKNTDIIPIEPKNNQLYKKKIKFMEHFRR